MAASSGLGALSFPPPSTNHASLAAGMAFLDGAGTRGWGVTGLCGWFSRYVIEPGFMTTPLVVTEPSAGTAPLYTRSHAPPPNLSRVLVAARSRVVGALRGLVASPADDRFVTGAIFAGRVVRRRGDGETEWVPRPEPTAPLSGIVLSLFAVDILSRREVYDRLLSVCEVCDRVGFAEGARHGCADHLPSVSGVIRRVSPPAS